MSVFLDWLQRYQFQVQSRSLQLASGRPARERKATYVKVDKDIVSAKLQYRMSVGSIFCYEFPHPSANVSFRDILTSETFVSVHVILPHVFRVRIYFIVWLVYTSYSVCLLYTSDAADE